MLKNKRFFLVALMAFIVCSTTVVEAQTDSPYSRYGFGRLRDQSTGPSKGMGGVGYALHTNQSANPMNPASYSQVDSLTFIFDIGVTYNNTTLKDGGLSASKSGGGLDYITMLFPVSKKLGLSLGILPFSTTSYKIGSVKNVGTGNQQYATQFSGSGGLSQVYFGAGYQLPVTGLSFGANASYIFGKIKHNKSLSQTNIEATDLSAQNTMLNINTVKVDLGLQYKIKFPNKNTLTLAAVYTPGMKTKGKFLHTEQHIRSTGTLISLDTLHNEMIDAGLPSSYGVGAAYMYNNKLLVSADITFQNWERVKMSYLIGDNLKEGERLNNKWKLAAGAEFRATPYSKNYFMKMKYRGGINYSNSYYNANTPSGEAKGFKEYGASIGLGLPIVDREDLGGRTSYININFEYKYLRPELKNMVSEKYFGISLNMNINELWFLQRKIF